MGDRKTLAWYTFGLTMIGLALLAVMIAIFAAMSIQWPSVVRGSLASNLTADYSAESAEAAVRQAPVRSNLILDKLAEEGGEATVPAGPLATAMAPFTPTSSPAATPSASNTPTATKTAVPTAQSASKATRVADLEPTVTPTPTPTATLVATDTPQPTVPPATEIPTATNVPRPTSPPPPPTVAIPVSSEKATPTMTSPMSPPAR